MVFLPPSVRKCVVGWAPPEPPDGATAYPRLPSLIGEVQGR